MTDAVMCGEAVKHGKPDPALFQRCANCSDVRGIRDVEGTPAIRLTMPIAAKKIGMPSGGPLIDGMVASDTESRATRMAQATRGAVLGLDSNHLTAISAMTAMAVRPGRKAGQSLARDVRRVETCMSAQCVDWNATEKDGP